MRLPDWPGENWRKKRRFRLKSSTPTISAALMRRFFRTDSPPNEHILLIRPATLADIPNIMALVAEAPTAAQWPREHYQQAIQNSHPRRIMLVLEDHIIKAFLV